MDSKSGTTDEFGMTLRTGRDPQMKMEGEDLTISDIGSDAPSVPVSPTTGEPIPSEPAPGDPTATSDPVEIALDDVDIDDIDTTDLDDPEGDPEGDLDEEPVASFDNLEDANTHIAKLNTENASRRVALKPFKEAFDGFGDEEQGQLLGLIHELGTSPRTAAEKLIAVGNIILGNEPGTVTPQADPNAEVDLDAPVTRRQLQEEKEKAQKDAEFQKEVDKVFEGARSLGYADNTVEQRIYLDVLANGADGDQAKAHEQVQALFQRKIREYIDGKRKQRTDATAGPTTTLSTETESHNPRTWKEATAAAVARATSKVGE